MTQAPAGPVVIDLNPDEERLYDRLRARVIEPRTGERSGLRDLLLLLPDFVVLLARLVADARVPRGSKWIASLALAYVASPIDLVPVLLLGPLGLVDDLIFVAGALSLLFNRTHPDIIRHHWSGQDDALHAVQRVTAWAEANVGLRLRLLLRSAGFRPGPAPPPR
ncbi:MAG: DUF1232 domain-containing protein [Myxococcota bacterium]|nr:DUF1232 domain-containing protein [Myxococcota bacterium]